MNSKDLKFREFYFAREGVKSESLAKAFWDAGWNACMEEVKLKQSQEHQAKKDPGIVYGGVQ